MKEYYTPDDTPGSDEFWMAFRGIDRVLFFYMDRAGWWRQKGSDWADFWMNDIQKCADALHAYIESRVQQADMLARDARFTRYNPEITLSLEKMGDKLSDGLRHKRDGIRKILLLTLCFVGSAALITGLVFLLKRFVV